MTNASSDRREGGTAWQPFLVTLLMPAIFAADIATSSEFRLSDLYCIVAFVMARVAGAGPARAIVSAGVALTLASVVDAYGVSAAALLHAIVSLALLGAAFALFQRDDRIAIRPQPIAMETAMAVPAPLLNELRQPLSVVLSDSRASLRWLKREQPDLPEALLCAQRIVSNATRAGEMISAMGRRAVH